MQQNKFKLSGPSILLLAMAFIAFILAKVYIPTPEDYEKQHAQVAHNNLQKDIAKSYGITVSELERKEKRGKILFNLRRDLNKAINQKDKVLLLNTLSDLSLSELKPKSSGLLSSSIKAQNMVALDFLIKKGISCNSKDNSGKIAFETSINVENSKYIKYLKENCNYSEKKSIAQRIMESNYPEKLYDLDENYDAQEFKDELFITQIKQRHPKAALRLLKKGISPNAKKESNSVLLMSVLANQREIVKELINLGADVTAINSGNMSILSAALLKSQNETARYILKENPDYFKTIEKERTVLRLIFSQLLNNNPIVDYEAFNVLLDFGIDTDRFVKEDGHLWLRKAIRLNNVKLAKQLLELGVDKNKQKNLNQLLKNAKAQYKNGSYTITELLKEYGAVEIVKKVKKKRVFSQPEKYSKLDMLLINTLWKNKQRYYQTVISGEITDSSSIKLKDGVTLKKKVTSFDFKKDNIVTMKFQENEKQGQWALSETQAQLFLDDATYEIVVLNKDILKIRYQLRLYGIELYDTYEFEPLNSENVNSSRSQSTH